jgi:hypothetical protein
VKASATELNFSGLTLRKLPDGTLRAYVAVQRKGKDVRELEFVYRPFKVGKAEGGR